MAVHGISTDARLHSCGSHAHREKSSGRWAHENGSEGGSLSVWVYHAMVAHKRPHEGWITKSPELCCENGGVVMGEPQRSDLGVVCPTCDAKRGKPCVRIMGAGKGAALDVPHFQRTKKARINATPLCGICSRPSERVKSKSIHATTLLICFPCERVVG